jgi:hypothetical protein
MRRSFVVILFVAILATAGTAEAVITNVEISPQGTGGVLGTSGIDTTIWKDFNPVVGLGPIDVIVTVDAAMPVYIHEETTSHGNGFIHNYSGQAWTDFHFEIISGAASFTLPPAYDVFTHATTTATKIDLDGGVVPIGTDFHAVLYLYASEPGTFVVRETATVPEPSTLVLLGGAIGLLACARRRHQR